MLTDRGLNQISTREFEQFKRKNTLETEPLFVDRVNCVVDALLRELDSAENREGWEVVVFRNREQIAFAWPGKKVGVSTRLVDILRSPPALAAALAPAIASVAARHASEKMANAIFGADFWPGFGRAMIGLGSQPPRQADDMRIRLEADALGLALTAKADFDPNVLPMLLAARVASTSQAQDTHAARLTHARNVVPNAMPSYEAAVQRHGLGRCASQPP